mmetsp:Transcript_39673/g.101921  ORF Transcript_39673/g.101921 Transcript_39673/m.101921 type:complete len:266 (-) Transcript_39673:3300-4097(-)
MVRGVGSLTDRYAVDRSQTKMDLAVEHPSGNWSKHRRAPFSRRHACTRHDDRHSCFQRKVQFPCGRVQISHRTQLERNKCQSEGRFRRVVHHSHDAGKPDQRRRTQYLFEKLQRRPLHIRRKNQRRPLGPTREAVCIIGRLSIFCPSRVPILENSHGFLGEQNLPRPNGLGGHVNHLQRQIGSFAGCFPKEHRQQHPHTPTATGSHLAKQRNGPRPVAWIRIPEIHRVRFPQCLLHGHGNRGHGVLGPLGSPPSLQTPEEVEHRL